MPLSKASAPVESNPNSREALLKRQTAGTLTWRGPALMLFARAALAVGAQAVAAAVCALRGSRTPWHDTEPWLPVYGTLIDAGCLALLWRLTRREGFGLFDLVGFDRARLVRDTLLGFALIPVSLVFILGGTTAVGWLVYRTLTRHTSTEGCRCRPLSMACWYFPSSGALPSR
jgi:hypothetical protein